MMFLQYQPEIFKGLKNDPHFDKLYKFIGEPNPKELFKSLRESDNHLNIINSLDYFQKYAQEHPEDKEANMYLGKLERMKENIQVIRGKLRNILQLELDFDHGLAVARGEKSYRNENFFGDQSGIGRASVIRALYKGEDIYSRDFEYRNKYDSDRDNDKFNFRHMKIISISEDDNEEIQVKIELSPMLQKLDNTNIEFKFKKDENKGE